MADNQDITVIQGDKVIFRPPFIPQDVELENDSNNHALKILSTLKVADNKELHLGGFKITHDANTLFFKKGDDLKMKLE